MYDIGVLMAHCGVLGKCGDLDINGVVECLFNRFDNLFDAQTLFDGYLNDMANLMRIEGFSLADILNYKISFVALYNEFASEPITLDYL